MEVGVIGERFQTSLPIPSHIYEVDFVKKGCLYFNLFTLRKINL